MIRLLFFLMVLAGSLLRVAAPAQDLPALAGAALSGSVEAVQELRRTGPAGLQALLEKAAPQVAELRQNKVRLDAEESVKLRAAVDAVAGQRDAWASGLYWFTDLEAARAEAEAARAATMRASRQPTAYEKRRAITIASNAAARGAEMKEMSNRASSGRSGVSVCSSAGEPPTKKQKTE